MSASGIAYVVLQWTLSVNKQVAPFLILDRHLPRITGRKEPVRVPPRTGNVDLEPCFLESASPSDRDAGMGRLIAGVWTTGIAGVTLSCIA